MPQSLKGISGFAISLFLIIAGFIFHSNPRLPFEEFELSVWLGLLLKFLFLLMTVASAGYFFKKIARLPSLDLPETFGFGIILLSCAALLFSILGYFGFEYLNFIIPALLLLNLELKPTIPSFLTLKNFFFKYTAEEKITFSIISIILAWLFILSCTPSQYEDPLYYQMNFIKNLAENGRYHFTEDRQFELITSWWETFLAWGYMLTGSTSNRGQIESMIISQWSTLILGVTMSIFAFKKLIKTIDESTSECVQYATLLIFSLSFFNTVSVTSKNDWIAFLFIVLSILFNLKNHQFFSGIFIGLAASTKMSLLLFMVPYSSIALIRMVKNSDKKGVLYFTAGSLFFTLPFFLRNWIYTNNPFFPTNPLNLKDSWMVLPDGGLRITTGKERILSFFFLIFICVKASWATALTPISIYSVYKSKNTKLKLLVYSSIFTILLFAFRFSKSYLPGDENSIRLTRYIAPAIIFLNFSNFYNILNYLKSRHKKPFAAIFISVAIFQGIVMNSTVFSSQNLTKKFSTPVQTFWNWHVGGKAKAWIRKNMSDDQTIISTGEYRTYLIEDYPFINILTNKKAFLTSKENNLLESFQLFKEMGGKVLYISKFSTFRTEFSRALEKLSLNHPSIVLFETEMSILVDIDKAALILNKK